MAEAVFFPPAAPAIGVLPARRGMRLRVRTLLVRQRSRTINAERGTWAEFGIVAPTGTAHPGRS